MHWLLQCRFQFACIYFNAFIAALRIYLLYYAAANLLIEFILPTYPRPSTSSSCAFLDAFRQKIKLNFHLDKFGINCILLALNTTQHYLFICSIDALSRYLDICEFSARYSDTSQRTHLGIMQTNYDNIWLTDL